MRSKLRLTPYLLNHSLRAIYNLFTINYIHPDWPENQSRRQHRASLNALRAGLTGQIVVLHTDDLVACQDHVDTFVTEYWPKGATEAQLVQSFADTAGVRTGSARSKPIS